jgi:hypothetical protein
MKVTLAMLAWTRTMTALAIPSMVLGGAGAKKSQKARTGAGAAAGARNIAASTMRATALRPTPAIKLEIDRNTMHRAVAANSHDGTAGSLCERSRADRVSEDSPLP